MSSKDQISCLVEGDALGGTKQRVSVDKSKCYTVEDVVSFIAPQLFHAESGLPVKLNPESTALQYFCLDEKRFVPLEDASQLLDKMKLKVVAIGSHGHENKQSGLNKAAQEALEAERGREERVAVEVVGMVVARLASQIHGDVALTTTDVDDLLQTVMHKHQMTGSLKTTLMAELRAEMAAGYIVGRQRRRRNPLEDEISRLRDVLGEQQDKIGKANEERHTLLQRIRQLEDEVDRLKRSHPPPELIETTVYTAATASSRPQSATQRKEPATVVADTTPQRYHYDDNDYTPSMPPAPHPTPAMEGRNPAFSGSFAGLPPSNSVPSGASHRKEPVDATPQRPVYADSDYSPHMPPAPHPTPAMEGRNPAFSGSFAGLPPSHGDGTTPTDRPIIPIHSTAPSAALFSGPLDSGPKPYVEVIVPKYTTTYSTSPAGSDRDRARSSAASQASSRQSPPPAPKAQPQRSDKLPTLNGAPSSAPSNRTDPTMGISASTSEDQTHMVTCFFNDWDPAKKINVKRGRAFVLSGAKSGTLYTQLQKAIANAWNREDLSVGYTYVDGTVVIIDSDAALTSYLRLATEKGIQKPMLQCFDPIEAGLYRPAPTGSSPTRAEMNSQGPAPPSSLSRGQTPSRPTSAASSRPASTMSMHTASSVPVETVSGSFLDDAELQWQWSQVSKDNLRASKDAVLKYVQQRYDVMGDPKRFHRLLAKFRTETLNYDEFCIVLFRLASG